MARSFLGGKKLGNALFLGSAVRAILFDLDGTLVDSRRDIADSVNHTLVQLGHRPLSVQRVETMVGDGVRQLLTRALGPLDEPTLRRALDVFLPFYLEHCVDATRLYPGVLETLRSFRGRLLGVVTNKPLAHTEKTLNALGLTALFAVVLAGDSLPTRKPRPEPLWEALRRMGVSSSESVMVGDSPMDIEAARAAGVPVVAVSYGFRSAQELRALRPNFLIHSFPELREVLA